MTTPPQTVPVFTDLPVTLRSWQEDAIKSYFQWESTRKTGQSKTFVAAISPGAGKTLYGTVLYKMLQELWGSNNRRVVVIASSNLIVDQWIQTFDTLGMSVTKWDGHNEIYDGIVTTYHMMARNRDALRSWTRGSFVILDECHHLADSQTWGLAASYVLDHAHRRLLLTGTPFREDEAAIPFVNYRDGELQTHFEYTYGDALRDGYVRSIYFHALDAGLRNDSGAERVISEHPEMLGYAVSPNGKAFARLLELAHDTLTEIRDGINGPAAPRAGGIVKCFRQRQARKAQRAIQQVTGTNPILAISDDPAAHDKILRFRDGDTHWLVVVGMGGEGLDIPRLRVGVWATQITSGLTFQQFAGRVIRQPDNQPRDSAFIYMPAHPDLITHAESLRKMRRHVLGEDKTDELNLKTLPGRTADENESLELFPGDVTTISHNIDDPVQQLTEIHRIAGETVRSMAMYGRSEELAAITLIQIRQILGGTASQRSDSADRDASDAFDLNTWREEKEQEKADDAFENLLDELRALTGVALQATQYLIISGESISTTDLADELDVSQIRPSDHFSRLIQKVGKGTYRAALDNYTPNQHRRIVQALEQADDG